MVVAVIALWQLRQYGAPLTRNARGLLGIDPLLVAAPAIGLLAGAVIATRVLPRVLEVAETLLERSRGLVGPMGGRGLARRPLRYTRSALLLMLAASLGTFAVAHVATWTRSQADQAAYQAGAAIRLAPSTKAAPGSTLAASLGAIPDVTAVMAVDRLSADAGRAVRGGALLAIDTDAATKVVNPTPGLDEEALASFYRQLAADRPRPIGAVIPDGAVALGLLLDSSFTNVSTNGEPEPVDLTKFPGVTATVVVEDGLGRYYRLSALAAGVLVGKGQRLVVRLGPDPGAGTGPGTGPGPGTPSGLVGPLRLHGIELGVTAALGYGMVGSVELREIEATTEPSADPQSAAPWLPIELTPTTPGWVRAVHFGNSPTQPLDPSATPWRLTFDNDSPLPPIFGSFGGEIAVAFTVRSVNAPILGIASSGFLEATGAKVGDSLTATLEGNRATIRIIGEAASFPTLDPAKPFLIVDGRTLAAARFSAAGSALPPGEWWIATSRPVAVERAIRAGLDPDAAVVTTATRAAALLEDPIPRGVIGVLGLGSWAALVFAAIGFVVSATVSTRERLGEFALLRALGLSGRQLSLWLALEHTCLLVVGILAGLGLGVVLAWLVLPFATLTTSGAAVTPPPVVVIPTTALLPIVAGAVAVLVATLAVMRRQLLGIHIGDVLRGQDE